MLNSEVERNPTHELLLSEYLRVRSETVELCSRLKTEDLVVQPVKEVSPPKWHLAHTTWFFEEFILTKHADYKVFSEDFKVLFNSYYKGVGVHWPQEQRGELSRPTVNEVYSYREAVDRAMTERIFRKTLTARETFLVQAGIEHEKQHQELLLMDIKAILGRNEPNPAYVKNELRQRAIAKPLDFEFINEGIFEVGAPDEGFAFDNERPRHRVFLERFGMANRLVTNGEFLEFIEDGGYSNPLLWLSLGWDWVQANHIQAPLYWRKSFLNWFEFTLHGLRPLELQFPVCHISYFEADAFARWKGLRLPTEFEYEIMLRHAHAEDLNDGMSAFVTRQYHPTDANAPGGQLWTWTQSHYSPYPGFQRFEGQLGEYNGKFMCNQFVLRGGCVATPRKHYRNSYRNFYEPQQRWMFSGIRLAEDGE